MTLIVILTCIVADDLIKINLQNSITVIAIVADDLIKINLQNSITVIAS